MPAFGKWHKTLNIDFHASESKSAFAILADLHYIWLLISSIKGKSQYELYPDWCWNYVSKNLGSLIIINRLFEYKKTTWTNVFDKNPLNYELNMHKWNILNMKRSVTSPAHVWKTDYSVVKYSGAQVQNYEA